MNLPADKFSSEENSSGYGKGLSTEKKQVVLNSKEELYAEIRDKNFNAVNYFTKTFIKKKLIIFLSRSVLFYLD